jgi:hypothetical protein
MAKNQQWTYDDRAGVALLVEQNDDGTTVEGSDKARVKRIEGGWRLDRKVKGQWQLATSVHSSLEAAKSAASKG